jgi:hypothetical protein
MDISMCMPLFLSLVLCLSLYIYIYMCVCVLWNMYILRNYVNIDALYICILWRVQVLETPFGLLLRFIYDFTSRHYNHCYNVTRTRLTASSLPCWFFILVGPLIAGFLVAALPFRLSSASVIYSYLKCSPPWNRALAPRIEDTLSKGNFSSVVQVVTGITFVNICCCHNNCLPNRCLRIATIRLSNLTCIWEPLHSKLPYVS